MDDEYTELMELQLQLDGLRRQVPDEDMEIVDGSIYVNYGHRKALVITKNLEPSGSMPTWVVEDYEWDRTGGVAGEVFLGEVLEVFIAPVVTSALKHIAALEAEMEAAMMPDE